MRILINCIKNKRRKVSFGNNVIKTLFWPSLAMMAIVCFVAVSNTVIVGNLVGDAGLCAVNLVFPLYTYANFFAGIIGIGSSLMYYRYLGENKKDRADKIFGQSIILSVVVGVLLFLAMTFGKNLFLDSLGVSGEIRVEAEAFWKYEKYLIALVPLNYLLLQMVYTNVPINVMANLSLFIAGIGLSALFTKLYGTMGASLGMLLGTVLSTIILCIHFFTKKNIFSFKWHFSWKDIGEMCRLSLVDSSKYLDGGLLLTFINSYVLSNYSQSMLTATTVVLVVFDMTIIFDSIGCALNPISEVYLGEGNYADEKACAKYAFKLSLLFGCVVMIILLIIAPYIPSMFGVSSASDVEIATLSIRIYAISMPFSAMAFMLISQYVAIRKVGLAVAFEWTKNFVAPLLCILILGKVFGFSGVWIAFILAEIITLFGFIIGVRAVAGKEKSIWLLKDNEYPTFSRSYIISEESAARAKDEVEKFLIERKIRRDIVFKIMLIIEETAMIILQKNPKRKVIVQYTLSIQEDKVLIYERDNGAIFDLSDTNVKIQNLRQYIYSVIVDTNFSKQYLLTASYNRNIFSIKNHQ